MSTAKKSSAKKSKKAQEPPQEPEATTPEVEGAEATAMPQEEPEEESAADAAAPVSEADVLKDRLTRLQADFENYRRRVLREKDETYRRANEDIMEEMLPVLDHLGLAFASASEEDLKNPVVEGVRLVADQLRGALSKFGLEGIDADGQPFDPNLHEAISHLPSEDIAENHVMAQVRCGYKLGSYLLRPAQVVVSSGTPGGAPVVEPMADAETNQEVQGE